MTCPSARESEVQLFSEPSRLLCTIPVLDVIQGLYRGGCQSMVTRAQYMRSGARALGEA